MHLRKTRRLYHCFIYEKPRVRISPWLSVMLPCIAPTATWSHRSRAYNASLWWALYCSMQYLSGGPLHNAWHLGCHCTSWFAIMIKHPVQNPVRTMRYVQRDAIVLKTLVVVISTNIVGVATHNMTSTTLQVVTVMLCRSACMYSWDRYIPLCRMT